MSATSIMEAAIKAAEEMPNEKMNNEQIVAFAIDNADRIVHPLMPPDATKQQQQHMVKLQTNALIYTITAKQINNGTYIGDDKLSENLSACIWQNVEFGSGDKVVTFLGEVRVSPEDFTKHGSNDGTSQLHKIMMSCEIYAKRKKVRVRLANVSFSFGVDRRYADESITRGETLLYMNQYMEHLKQQLKDVNEGGEVIVVATDSIRIHLEAKMVQYYEDDLRSINPNAKLRFIETWGLVGTIFCDVTKMLVPAAARAAESREGHFREFGKLSTSFNPDKSIVVSGPDQQKQDNIKARGRVIQKLYKGDGSSELKTHIGKTENLGEELMKYLSNKKVEVETSSGCGTKSLLQVFRDKWNSLAMEEDSEEAAEEFQKFYLDNKEHMQDFLQRHDLPEIFDVNYVRTSKKEDKQPPDYQIGINFAAAEMDNNDKNIRPNITIYDSGKRRNHTGNPGFVAIMVLICTGKVRRTIMLNPARASSEPTEDMLMMELFTQCNKSKDAKQLFSECIGKDAKELVRAEHARQKVYKQIQHTYDEKIRELEDKLISEIDKTLYNEMKLIYTTRIALLRRGINDDTDEDESMEYDNVE